MYLKAFATGEGQKASFIVFKLKSGECFKTNIQNIASENYFNNIEGKDPFIIEKELSKMESEISPALEEVIIERKFPSVKHRNLILDLISMISARNPLTRARNEKYFINIANKLNSNMLHSREEYEKIKEQAIIDGIDEIPNIDYNNIKESYKSGGMQIKVNKNYLMKKEIEIMEQIFKVLKRIKWQFVTAIKGNQFVTSDVPVVLDFFDNHKRTLNNSPRFGDVGTFVFFALSPDLALCGHLDAPDISINFNMDIAAYMNERIIRHANRHIFAKSKDFMFQGYDGSYLKSIQISEYIHQMNNDIFKNDIDLDYSP